MTLDEAKRIAIALNRQSTQDELGVVIAEILEPLFGDQHAAAMRFYTRLECEMTND